MFVLITHVLAHSFVQDVGMEFANQRKTNAIAHKIAQTLARNSFSFKL
jgi:hypothetical protein